MTHHTIHLTYDQVNDVLHSHPDPITIAVGDSVTFTSSQGPVSVLFIPAESFSAGHFHSGDQPVRRLQGGPSNVCCGVVIGGKVWGFPEHNRFGHAIIPDSA